MNKPLSNTPSSASDDRNLVAVDENYLAPNFEDTLRLFWAKNSRAIVIGCALVFLVILGRGAYGLISSQREKAITADYAAATSNSQLKAFVDSHGSHVLAGLAQLRLADSAYGEGQYIEAKAAYVKAAGILKKNTFGQRAQLGAAISALQSGATTEGEALLKQVSTDLEFSQSFRAEAAYNLASLAASAGNASEAVRYVEQVMSIAPEGQWSERAAMLRSSLPSATTAEVTADSSPSLINLK